MCLRPNLRCSITPIIVLVTHAHMEVMGFLGELAVNANMLCYNVCGGRTGGGTFLHSQSYRPVKVHLERLEA